MPAAAQLFNAVLQLAVMKGQRRGVRWLIHRRDYAALRLALGKRHDLYGVAFEVRNDAELAGKGPKLVPEEPDRRTTRS